MKPVRPIASLVGDQLIYVEDAVERIDGLLEAVIGLDWDRPTLHDGKAVLAIVYSALTQLSIIESAMKKIRENDRAE